MGCSVNNLELYEMLDFPDQVIEGLSEYENSRVLQIPEALKEKLLIRKYWEEAVNGLKALLGEDEKGFKILWELMNMVVSKRTFLCGIPGG